MRELWAEQWWMFVLGFCAGGEVINLIWMVVSA